MEKTYTSFKKPPKSVEKYSSGAGGRGIVHQ